jgi:hypothetical protein
MLKTAKILLPNGLNVVLYPLTRSNLPKPLQAFQRKISAKSKCANQISFDPYWAIKVNLENKQIYLLLIGSIRLKRQVKRIISHYGLNDLLSCVTHVIYDDVVELGYTKIGELLRHALAEKISPNVYALINKVE